MKEPTAEERMNAPFQAIGPSIKPKPEGWSTQCFPCHETPGAWRVEYIIDDGRIEVAIFSGPNAEKRALVWENLMQWTHRMREGDYE